MNATKITKAEVDAASVAALPTRPTASTAFGGKGFTSQEMKEAFDKLPLLVIRKYNTLIDDITSGLITNNVPTQIENLPMLKNVLGGIKDGKLADSLVVGESSLTYAISKMREEIRQLATALGITLEEWSE